MRVNMATPVDDFHQRVPNMALTVGSCNRLCRNYKYIRWIDVQLKCRIHYDFCGGFSSRILPISNCKIKIFEHCVHSNFTISWVWYFEGKIFPFEFVKYCPRSTSTSLTVQFLESLNQLFGSNCMYCAGRQEMSKSQCIPFLASIHGVSLLSPSSPPVEL